MEARWNKIKRTSKVKRWSDRVGKTVKLLGIEDREISVLDKDARRDIVQVATSLNGLK